MDVAQIVPRLNETLDSSHSSVGRKEGRKEKKRQADRHTYTQTEIEKPGDS